MDVVIISQLEAADETIEIVEHKGLGHPDAICDALAENLSRNLCREYRSRFGEILHHNVDKALLRGGRAMAELAEVACLSQSRFTWRGGRYPRSEALRFPYPK